MFPGGIITEEGMDADFQSFKQANLGYVDWMDSRFGRILPVSGLPPPVEAISPKWYELIGKQGELAREDGLFLCPQIHLGNFVGVAADDLKHMPNEVLFSSVQVQGGRTVSVTVPQPETHPIAPWPGAKDYYRDIAVYAYPTPDVKRTKILTEKPEITVNAPYASNGLGNLCDGNVNTFWGSIKPLENTNPPQITFSFDRPFEAAGLSVIPAYHKGPEECVLEAAGDEKIFHEVTNFTLGVDESKQVAFHRSRPAGSG